MTGDGSCFCSFRPCLVAPFRSQPVVHVGPRGRHVQLNKIAAGRRASGQNGLQRPLLGGGGLPPTTREAQLEAATTLTAKTACPRAHPSSGVLGCPALHAPGKEGGRAGWGGPSASDNVPEHLSPAVRLCRGCPILGAAGSRLFSVMCTMHTSPLVELRVFASPQRTLERGVIVGAMVLSASPDPTHWA